VILIVDDNRQFRDALDEFLSLQGYGVRCAADGAEALQVLANSGPSPQIIFLDVLMPVVDGWDFLTALRRHPRFAGVPVVIITARDETATRAKEAGAVAVVRKPVEPQLLLRLIHRFGKRAPNAEVAKLFRIPVRQRFLL
jgi:CheY-like chemotaxis protein